MKGLRMLAVLAVALVAACAAPDRTAAPGIESPAASKSTTEDLLAYLARIRGANESALAAEAARQKREATDLARVKAALALSLNPESSETEIVALVDPVMRKEGVERQLRAMASFVHAAALERRRLKETASAAQSRLRDERKLAESQRQRAESLQQKLDALTDLEKSLADRAAPAR